MYSRIKYRFGLKPSDFPKPETDSEFSIITDIYFGKPLSVHFDLYSYKIIEEYNSYHGDGFQYGQCDYTGYDHSALFLKHIFGELRCGGIATNSYGQYEIKGYRNKKRLEKWINNRAKGINYSRTSFNRLADKYGVGENRMNLDSSVLTNSRVDGILEVS